ncbi:MAG: leucyl aminopeptidase family protein, partial [Rhodobacteraceae bacterium]|nr:leucyl aminopeptidase family protein [Paracoccaceae bacterium]
MAEFLAHQSDSHRRWLEAAGFTGALKQCVVLPGPDGEPTGAAIGYGGSAKRKRSRFHLAEAVAKLPEGAWHIETPLDPREADEACLAWLLAGYRFSRYKAGEGPKASLKPPVHVDAARISVIARAEAMTRDLINTPASDMGPDELEAAFRDLARTFNASVTSISGDALLDSNLPLIHAVGRASNR